MWSKFEILKSISESNCNNYFYKSQNRRRREDTGSGGTFPGRKPDRGNQSCSRAKDHSRQSIQDGRGMRHSESDTKVFFLILIAEPIVFPFQDITYIVKTFSSDDTHRAKVARVERIAAIRIGIDRPSVSKDYHSRKSYAWSIEAIHSILYIYIFFSFHSRSTISSVAVSRQVYPLNPACI